MKLLAPAKINLSLRILGKRNDGFHEIESLIVPISLADEITVDISDGRTLRVDCDNPELPRDDSNVAAVAARQFYSHTGRQFSAHISIRKRIPHAAGLGGGSSDAAAVLVALDSFFETNLGLAELEKIAANIGSDVPFFVRGIAAWCRGRGELIEPANVPDRLHLLLVKPPFGVETPWAYRSWASSIEIPDVPYAAQWAGQLELVNDLERPVFEKYLFLPVMKRWFLRQPETKAALMSGSGSTMFALCGGPEEAISLEAKARAAFGDSCWYCISVTNSRSEIQTCRLDVTR